MRAQPTPTWALQTANPHHLFPHLASLIRERMPRCQHDPFYALSYDCFTYPSPTDVTLPSSTAMIWNPNVNPTCWGCHGSCGFDGLYQRAPF